MRRRRRRKGNVAAKAEEYSYLFQLLFYLFPADHICCVFFLLLRLFLSLNMYERMKIFSEEDDDEEQGTRNRTKTRRCYLCVVRIRAKKEKRISITSFSNTSDELQWSQSSFLLIKETFVSLSCIKELEYIRSIIPTDGWWMSNNYIECLLDWI